MLLRGFMILRPALTGMSIQTTFELFSSEPQTPPIHGDLTDFRGLTADITDGRCPSSLRETPMTSARTSALVRRINAVPRWLRLRNGSG
jgi:hypothetical protein